MKKIFEFLFGPDHKPTFPIIPILICFLIVNAAMVMGTHKQVINTSFSCLGVIVGVVIMNLIRMKSYDKKHRKK